MPTSSRLQDLIEEIDRTELTILSRAVERLSEIKGDPASQEEQRRLEKVVLHAIRVLLPTDSSV